MEASYYFNRSGVHGHGGKEGNPEGRGKNTVWKRKEDQRERRQEEVPCLIWYSW